MIDTEPRARALANKMIRGVRLFTSDPSLTPDSPDVMEARALFCGEVVPSLHRVFDVVLAEIRATPGPPAAVVRRRGQILVGVFVALFLGALGGMALLAYTYVIGPGEAANTAALDAWVAAARGGKVSAPRPTGPSTDAAVRALGASISHRITHTSGSYDFSGGTTCFDVEASGPRGATTIAVRVSNDSGSPVVTDVGLRPPCECSSKGRMMGCSP